MDNRDLVEKLRAYGRTGECWEYDSYVPKSLLLAAADKIEETGYENWFGLVKWCDEDIAAALAEHGYEVNKDTLSVIRKHCEHSAFKEGMTETGWDYIHAYIFESKEALKPYRTEAYEE